MKLTAKKEWPQSVSGTTWTSTRPRSSSLRSSWNVELPHKSSVGVDFPSQYLTYSFSLRTTRIYSVLGCRCMQASGNFRILSVTRNARGVNKFVRVAMYFRYAGDWTELNVHVAVARNETPVTWRQCAVSMSTTPFLAISQYHTTSVSITLLLLLNQDGLSCATSGS